MRSVERNYQRCSQLIAKRVFDVAVSTIVLLLSREATAAVGSAFSTLTETVKKHEPTLEDVVRETLRPMLKSWLDENLPRLVEQMVQAEIERVARGR